MKDLSHHPVWDIYDEFRTARLNVKYYAALLRKYQQLNFWLELTLAISAPTSAVAGLWFWQTEVGTVIWHIFGAIAAVVAVAKPLLGISDKLARLEAILGGYKSLDYDFHYLTIRIKQEQKYDEAMQQDFYDLLRKEGELIKMSKIEADNKKLSNICQQEVLDELPVDSFFIPED